MPEYPIWSGAAGRAPPMLANPANGSSEQGTRQLVLLFNYHITHVVNLDDKNSCKG